uniref:Uncharacterized protein n=1 Tax=Arundo donax TaxID=35708 RepID=A0A0A8YTM1_ARUDO
MIGPRQPEKISSQLPNDGGEEKGKNGCRQQHMAHRSHAHDTKAVITESTDNLASGSRSSHRRTPRRRRADAHGHHCTS